MPSDKVNLQPTYNTTRVSKSKNNDQEMINFKLDTARLLLISINAT